MRPDPIKHFITIKGIYTKSLKWKRIIFLRYLSNSFINYVINLHRVECNWYYLFHQIYLFNLTARQFSLIHLQNENYNSRFFSASKMKV